MQPEVALVGGAKYGQMLYNFYPSKRLQHIFRNWKHTLTGFDGHHGNDVINKVSKHGGIPYFIVCFTLDHSLLNENNAALRKT